MISSLQSDIHLLWIGSPPQLSTIHTSLLAPKTLSILSTSVSQPYPHLPIAFHTVLGTTHETFEIYRNFLYTGKLCTHDAYGDQDYADNGDAEAHEDREWVRLALAYFLGLKLGDEGFCNAVVDGIVEKMAEAVRFPLLFLIRVANNMRMLADILSRTAPPPASPPKSTPTHSKATNSALCWLTCTSGKVHPLPNPNYPLQKISNPPLLFTSLTPTPQVSENGSSHRTTTPTVPCTSAAKSAAGYAPPDPRFRIQTSLCRGKSICASIMYTTTRRSVSVRLRQQSRKSLKQTHPAS